MGINESLYRSTEAIDPYLRDSLAKNYGTY